MKKYNPQQKDSELTLSRSIRIHGYDFKVNIDGCVETIEFNCLGHIADCQDFAALIYDLMEIFETSAEI